MAAFGVTLSLTEKTPQQIICPLPADPRVNVVAQVCEPDLALLPYAADPAYQFEFCE